MVGWRPHLILPCIKKECLAQMSTTRVPIPSTILCCLYFGFVPVLPSDDAYPRQKLNVFVSRIEWMNGASAILPPVVRGVKTPTPPLPPKPSSLKEKSKIRKLGRASRWH